MQIDRIEVERQMPQQRCAGQHDDEHAGDDGNAMPLQEIIQRREASEPDRRGLARRIEQRQHRRDQRDAAGECDQHAATGNQAQFRKTAIAGRQKREKRHGRGRTGQGERISRLAGGPSQRFAQVAVVVPFGAIAHAELNAEVYSETYEQHEERDRDQVESADHGQPDSGCYHKANHQAEEYRGNDLPGAKRQPENDQDAEHRRQRVAHGAVSDDRELVVIHRHLAGQFNRRAVLVLQVQIGGRASNPLLCPQSRLKFGKIKLGLNSDQVPQLLFRQRVALQ